jgi:hypothetical protein
MRAKNTDRQKVASQRPAEINKPPFIHVTSFGGIGIRSKCCSFQ